MCANGLLLFDYPSHVNLKKKGVTMEYLPEEVKEIFERYLLKLTSENVTIMLARLVLAVATQEEGLPI